MLPAICFIQLYSFAKVCTVSLQLNLNICGPCLITVVIIVPDLFNCNLSGLQRVGDPVAVDDLIEAGYFRFIYCVDDLGLAVCAPGTSASSTV